MKKTIYVIVIILGFISFINLPFWSGIYDRYFLKNTIDYKLTLLNNMSKSPDIIFFGSSNSEQGLNAQTLEEEYSKLINKKVTAFNFSIPAAMYLEKYYLLKYLVDKGKKPKLIVLHYVPKTNFIYTKDIFYASYFTYDKALRISDLSDLSKSYISNKSLLEFYFAYFYKPYLYRGVLFDNLAEFYHNIREGKNPEINFVGLRTRYSIRGDLESKFVPSETKFANKKYEVSKLLATSFNKKIEFNEKHQYAFNKIIKYAKENHIEVLITNIPEVLDIARTNENSKYLDSVLQVNKEIYEAYSKEKNVHFIDLIGNNKFNLFDSVDGHHLTFNSSLKLTKLLAMKMSSDLKINKLFNNDFLDQSELDNKKDTLKLLFLEKNPLKKYYLLKNCYDNDIQINNEYLIKLTKDDNDYLALQATNYLFKYIDKEHVQIKILEELKTHKVGGPYSIARFENIMQNMINYKFKLKNSDLKIIEDISFEDFIRLNIVFEYLQNVNLEKQYIQKYIDVALKKLSLTNNIDNIDILINLYNLINVKGTDEQMNILKNKLLMMNMKDLLKYLESNSYYESLK
ncbi:hypothetical protein [Arcobacter sp. F2176]|uniref:hypothetical protein n=1 Tax=Arcobacter sp. F2176 TaxID=2044511 RepID=UPI00100BD116|nr:hypothetical protein [Arcobacter sp. F2176]RXJ78446.1 hypothetical protein CRU95_15560 [Arcobacter sp. F2176]